MGLYTEIAAKEGTFIGYVKPIIKDLDVVGKDDRKDSFWQKTWESIIGADALCGIKEVGGIAIAQKPETAKKPDMPETPIASGCIDFVLSPEEIALQIKRIVLAG